MAVSTSLDHEVHLGDLIVGQVPLPDELNRGHHRGLVVPRERPLRVGVNFGVLRVFEVGQD